MSAKWTTEQIPDQTGRTAIVTGANSLVGANANDSTPLWVRAVAAVVNTVGVTRDVLAASR